MKENDTTLKRRPYLAPRSEVLEIEQCNVLCSSALLGNSTESVTTETFIFP